MTEGEPDAERVDRWSARASLLAVWLIALVAVAAVGLLLVLFSWVTTTLPSSQLMACPEFEGCAPQTLGADEPAPLDVPGLDEPRIVP